MSRQSKKIEKNCIVCNKIFHVFPSVIEKGYRKYCSLKCSGIGQNKKIERTCIVCNKIFITYSSIIKIGKGKFCSYKCTGIEKTRAKNSPEHFWSQVDIKEDKELCWEWKKCESGYGKLLYNKKSVGSHRLAYFLTYPEQDTEENRKLHVLHKCNNPTCCNPYHLFLGTHQDNVDDKVNKNRQTKGEKHWKSKLDEFDVKQILLLKGILKIQTVADMYKVDYYTIYYIFNNKRWKHIERNI